MTSSIMTADLLPDFRRPVDWQADKKSASALVTAGLRQGLC